ncbi:hypothetical protein BGX31_002928, partial [Mortierella sp. GBA43]
TTDEYKIHDYTRLSFKQGLRDHVGGLCTRTPSNDLYQRSNVRTLFHLGYIRIPSGDRLLSFRYAATNHVRDVLNYLCTTEFV